jgi:hypothetical protein
MKEIKNTILQYVSFEIPFYYGYYCSSSDSAKVRNRITLPVHLRQKVTWSGSATLPVATNEVGAPDRC